MLDKQNQKGATPVWLAIIMVAAVGFLVWLVWSLVGSRSLDITQKGAVDQQEEPFVKPVPDEVRTVVGNVTSVEGNLLTVMAPSDRNFFTEDRQLSISVSADTDVQISAPAAPETGRLIQRRQGSLSDLAIGDEVSVTIRSTDHMLERRDALEVEIVR